MKRISFLLLVLSLTACKTVSIKNIPLPVKIEGQPLSVKVEGQPLSVKTDGQPLSVNINNTNPVPVTVSNPSSNQPIPFSKFLQTSNAEISGVSGHLINIEYVYCNLNQPVEFSLRRGNAIVAFKLVDGFNKVHFVLDDKTLAVLGNHNGGTVYLAGFDYTIK